MSNKCPRKSTTLPTRANRGRHRGLEKRYERALPQRNRCLDPEPAQMVAASLLRYGGDAYGSAGVLRFVGASFEAGAPSHKGFFIGTQPRG